MKIVSENRLQVLRKVGTQLTKSLEETDSNFKNKTLLFNDFSTVIGAFTLQFIRK